jgi:hypothetical protein
MRSDLVFGALAHISNRYHLCRLTSKATRKFHVPKARLQEMTNDVLVRLRHSLPISADYTIICTLPTPPCLRAELSEVENVYLLWQAE